MRTYIWAAVCAIASGSLSAQIVPPRDHGARLLESHNPREKAWGAWYAGQAHQESMREALLKQLNLARQFREAARDSAEYAYVQSLFDALIQTPGTVPLGALLPFETSWRPEILILLSRSAADPANETALLALREHNMTEPEWSLVNDILFSLSSKTFFTKVLEELQTTHDVVFTDGWVGWCGGAYGLGGGTRHFPKGFPPVGLYRLRSRASDIPLWQQPVEIAYSRIPVPTDGETEWSEEGEVPALRQMRLAQLAGSIDGISLQESEALFHPRTEIRWAGTDSARVEVEQVLNRQKQAIQELVRHARRRGLLDGSEPAVTIRVKIMDVRSNKSEPAPQVEAAVQIPD